MSEWTRVHRQFWREGEQKWVDHVLIRSDELVDPVRPSRWRYRTITTTETASEWQDGKP